MLPPSAPVPNPDSLPCKSLIRFVRHESGATAIEYGLVSTFIGMAVLGAFRAYGTVLSDFLSAVTALIKFE